MEDAKNVDEYFAISERNSTAMQRWLLIPNNIDKLALL